MTAKLQHSGAKWSDSKIDSIEVFCFFFCFVFKGMQFNLKHCDELSDVLSSFRFLVKVFKKRYTSLLLKKTSFLLQSLPLNVGSFPSIFYSVHQVLPPRHRLLTVRVNF